MISTRICLGALWPVLALSSAAAVLQENWEAGYAPGEAAAPHVLGCWTFDGENALKDASGKGHDLTLRGANAAAVGRFGGGLESFPGFPVEDKTHGAHTAAKPAGPEPTIATVLPVFMTGKIGVTNPSLKPRSTMFHSMTRMETGSSLIPSTQAPSQGAGQSRPVNSGKLFVVCRAFSASCQRPR